MLTEQRAAQLATDWIASWNAHDLARILEHYADDVEFSSPVVAQLTGTASGTLYGKDALRSYFRQALDVYPDLNFQLIKSLVGVSSITLYYRSVKNLLAAEVMQIDEKSKVTKVLAHYAEA